MGPLLTAPSCFYLANRQTFGVVWMGVGVGPLCEVYGRGVCPPHSVTSVVEINDGLHIPGCKDSEVTKASAS